MFVFLYFLSEKCCPGQHLNVDLYLTSGSPKQRCEPRYSMTTVDIPQSSGKNGKFAIFIVPQGTVIILLLLLLLLILLLLIITNMSCRSSTFQ